MLGRPLPTLFNWYPKDLNCVTPEEEKILRGQKPLRSPSAAQPAVQLQPRARAESPWREYASSCPTQYLS
ncbi:hypothetical protein ABBQ38_008649 [Trebouxia sp. C0009 RCD-2024]